MKKIFSLLALVLLAITLVACGDSDKRTGDTVEITQTITVTTDKKNDKGDFITEKQKVTQKMFVNPTRVVSFSYGVADMLYQVNLFDAGIKEFALAKGTGVPSIIKQFDSDVYPNAGTLFEDNREVIDLINPELIILDGRSSGLYSGLKKAYPNADILDASNTTYALSKQQEVVEILGKLFPKVKAKLDEKMASIVEDFNGISEISKEYKALFLMSSGKDLSVSGKTGRYGVLHNEFGFAEADKDGAVGDAHGNVISLEYLKTLDDNGTLDVIFIMDRAKAVGNIESGLASLKNEAQFKALNAVKNGRVYELNPDAWYLVTGGFSSTEQMVKDIMTFINDVTNESSK
ncbi:MAG: ABC transporter substrate-binding protein [Acholeplasma sp.]|nr:ABC transporter substrate-binding protein [Acholeplasma sp.]